LNNGIRSGKNSLFTTPKGLGNQINKSPFKKSGSFVGNDPVKMQQNLL